ncbi:adenylyl-sulfate kinase [Pseudorhodoplanes sp.]|uniref:adenylyl-sulfate kinase n=1 Tax=Pseudorhodoplanes sp. TaxID=1934341 RepID=UPI00391A1CE4
MRAPITERDHLRFLACGAVDDGKSTLIGRLMAETGSVPDDLMANLVHLSKKFGTTGGDLDYALLLDGLEAEREQGITIDVAYRYFGTPKRAFIVADTPGHEQYTRNMVTGASNAEFALLLVDAKAGLTRQTLRHSRILSLLGIKRVLLVVNKMDLVDCRQAPFDAIRDEYQVFAAQLQFEHVEAIPIVARDGDNIVRRSERMAWYQGPTVLQHLETVPISTHQLEQPARFHVQSVVRTQSGGRGYAGYMSSGVFNRGDTVLVGRSHRSSTIKHIYIYPDTVESLEAGQAATIELTDQVDVSRGDILAPADHPPDVADQFAAHLVWLNENPMLPGRTYSLRIGTHTVAATVTALKHGTDIETGEHAAVTTLAINDIGFCNIATTEPIAFDAYAKNRETGAFILIDRQTGATAGAGMVEFPLYRASNLVRQSYEIDKAFRAKMKGQRPATVWFTGLPSAGKSTILNLVEQKLSRRGVHTYALDGDNMRLGLNRDLGFTEADRVENVRRAGEVARLMTDAGLVVLCAFVSPFRNERQSVRERHDPGEFIEVFVDTPLAVCEQRDPKGLYAKARAGKAFHVTGIDSPYEPPLDPEVRLRTETGTPDEMAEQVIAQLVRFGIIAR